MKWLIKSIQLGVLLHILWAATTGLVITLALGDTVEVPFAFIGLPYPTHVCGIQGEAFFTWPFHMLTALTRILYLYAFYRLWRLFGAFSNNAYFARSTIGHLKAFTGLFTVFTLSRVAISWIFISTTGNSIPELRSMAIDFSDLEDLTYPVLFYVIAHILGEARKNEEELDSYF